MAKTCSTASMIPKWMAAALACGLVVLLGKASLKVLDEPRHVVREFIDRMTAIDAVPLSRIVDRRWQLACVASGMGSYKSLLPGTGYERVYDDLL